MRPERGTAEHRDQPIEGGPYGGEAGDIPAGHRDEPDDEDRPDPQVFTGVQHLVAVTILGATRPPVRLFQRVLGPVKTQRQTDSRPNAKVPIVSAGSQALGLWQRAQVASAGWLVPRAPTLSASSW